MKFNARRNNDPKKRQAFIKWLVDEAASGLRRTKGDTEALRAPVFLFLNRAYEAGLEAADIWDLFGVKRGNVLNKARLSREDRQAVVDTYARLDPIVAGTYHAG